MILLWLFLSGFAAMYVLHFFMCYRSSINDLLVSRRWRGAPKYVTDVIEDSGLKHVLLLRRDLGRNSKGNRTLGMSWWLPFLNVVIVDTWFSRIARPDQLRFLVAHECGHLSLHHSKRGFVYVASMFTVGAITKSDIERYEVEADQWAYGLTGLTREIYADLPRF